LEGARQKLAVPLKRLCAVLRLSYSTLMRWRHRQRGNEPLLKRPGPKKGVPLEIAGLMEAIRDLSHGVKRTKGTEALYARYQDHLSRREFLRRVREARREARKEQLLDQKHIEWKQPGLCWSMDDTRFGVDQEGRKLFLHTVRDLSSKYLFAPPAGDFARGQKVAENLRGLFERYGAPLFMKRDNGGNLNHALVEAVLAEFAVIPLNSPTYYPPYNGSVERAQDEVKDAVQARLLEGQAPERAYFATLAEAASQDLNHRPRRCLKGAVSCQVFFEKKGGARFSKRQRRAIFDWIKGLACAILSRLKEDTRRAAQAAWRMAVETWLRQNGYITVTVTRDVSPNFIEKNSHD
jgi:hypothetical protein